MFRKTFIRLILVIVIASASLILFSATRNEAAASKEACSETSEDCKIDKSKGDLIILESLGRNIISAANY
jgi:hypothetical protein